MKLRQALAFSLIVLIHLGAFATLSAAAKSKKPSAPAPPPDTRKLVTSINLKNDTIVISDKLAKTDHTYAIDAMTKVQVGNLPGQFADLKVGMKVDDLTERDNDTLDSITVETDLTPSSDTPSKKKKK